jgi:hypothetical protein
MSAQRPNVDTELPTPQATPSPRMIRARRLAIRVIYGLISLMTLTMAMGLVGLVTGGVPDGPYAFAAAGTTALKLLSLGGYLVIMWTAGRNVVAVQWVVVGQLTWLVAELVAPQDPSESVLGLIVQYAAITAVYLGPWVVLAPERTEVLHLRARPDRTALTLVAVSLPASVLWARHNAGLVIATIDGGSPDELRFDIVALSLVLWTVGMFAALRPSGRRWPLGVVAAGALYLGTCAALADSHDLANPGLPAGIALLALGVFLAWRAHQPVPHIGT